MRCRISSGPAHLGHDHVADDEIEILALEQVDRLCAAAAGDRLVIQILERADGRGADSRVVLDEQYSSTGDMDVGILAPLDRRMDPDFRGLFRARKVDGNGRSPANLAFDPDLAAGLVGKAEDLAEAETSALADRLGGEEGLERAVEHSRGHPAAGVGDADLHIFARTDVADLVRSEAHILRSRCASTPRHPSHRAH